MGILERVRVEWAAATFGLLVGVTMVYVPYEFVISLYQIIYPHIRLLGAVFLVSSATMVAAMLYPDWPSWVGWLGRGAFLGAIAVYWWTVTILPRGMTGALLYPLMVAGLLGETLPRWRDRGLFLPFLASLALAFGGLMLLDPRYFGQALFAALQPVVLPVGLLYLGGGLLLFIALVRRWCGLVRLAVGVLGVLFVYLGFVLASSRSWAGMEIYLVIAAECLLALVLRRMPQPSGVRWRLFRGMAFASVLPILGLGAIVSVLAQKAIERELRGNARQAVAAEVAWLEQTASMARAMLLTHSEDPAFLAGVRAREPIVMQSRVAMLEHQPGLFDAAWLLDSTGDPLVPSFRLGPVHANLAHRDYFQLVQRDGQPSLSLPYINAVGLPFVAFAVPVDADLLRRDVLAGGISLVRLGLQPTLASRSYHVQLFDQRDGSLLRDTEHGDVLTRAKVLSLVGEGALSTPEGMTEAFDPSGRRLLIAHGQVPGAPWTVAVTTPLREAFAPVTRLSALVVGIAVLAGAIALLLSQWVGRDVAQRLEVLRDGFTGLGTLPLDHPVPARGDDELAQLTSGFNEMAARIDRTQKELREAIAIRDQFLSIASHELRTPLTPLKATVDLLLRKADAGQGLDPEKQRATLERLRRQVERLTRLVNDMLDVARIQSGRFSLKPSPVDLCALAREVVDRTQHAQRDRSAPIQLTLATESLVGQWDEQRLDQLLTNLIENAVRYSPPDAPIQVRVRPEGSGALLEVEDRGIGIPPENLSHLFMPFYRAPNAAKHYAGGLGLGLSICREIVERHHGTLRATSAGVGQGTCFSAFLPKTVAPKEGGS
ncbi:ATP-binding protein [Hyalangium rubrum]|uniref:histidine kinase n=1 Tax=Hyalangium rubrum TaxID=3103134 RepID=A0ABU5H795_9BACT|nr:ATP-binding protein [Hyalangium sp. s54d21]MDY7229166.1 ATP-binding protein [Hyalangium sp. s54d21]